MAEVLKTKSQMILRIAELSEQNTLLRDELYRKSETEQALQTALEENKELKEANNEYKKAGAELLAEKNALQIGYDEIREAKGRFKKVLERVREDICSFCIECQCECKECTVFEIKTQIDEVLQ